MTILLKGCDSGSLGALEQAARARVVAARETKWIRDSIGAPCGTGRQPVSRLILHVELEQLLGVVLEDHFLLSRAQPVEVFDQVARFVEPAVGARVLHGA